MKVAVLMGGTSSEPCTACTSETLAPALGSAMVPPTLPPVARVACFSGKPSTDFIAYCSP